MHDSITIAVVGSIVNVSGKRIATPFGPPSPGNTPTKMPSTRPTIMKASVLNVSRTVKPWNSRPKASIARSWCLIAEGRFQRSFWHDDVERDVEGDEHDEREQEAGDQRLPQGNASDEPHEAHDQHEARHIETEPLHEHAEKQGRHEDLHHAAE